jgi:hypothetical protein
VKARGGIGLDLQARLEQITWSLLELVELQAKYRDEVREIVPNFALQLRDAYEAVSEAGAAIDHRKRPDLDEMTQEANHLLRTLNEPPPHHHSAAGPLTSFFRLSRYSGNVNVSPSSWRQRMLRLRSPNSELLGEQRILGAAAKVLHHTTLQSPETGVLQVSGTH